MNENVKQSIVMGTAALLLVFTIIYLRYEEPICNKVFNRDAGLQRQSVVRECRTLILRKFANAHRADNERRIDFARDMIYKFNQSGNGMLITVDVMYNSLIKRAKEIALQKKLTERYVKF